MHDAALVPGCLLSYRKALLKATGLVESNTTKFLHASMLHILPFHSVLLEYLESEKHPEDIYVQVKKLAKENSEILAQEMEDHGIKMVPAALQTVDLALRKLEGILHQRRQKTHQAKQGRTMRYFSRSEERYAKSLRDTTHNYSNEFNNYIKGISMLQIAHLKNTRASSRETFLEIGEVIARNPYLYGALERQVADAHHILHNCNGNHEIDKLELSEMITYSALSDPKIEIITASRTAHDIMQFIFKNRSFLDSYVKRKIPADRFEIDIYHLKKKDKFFTGDVFHDSLIYDVRSQRLTTYSRSL